MKASAVAFFLLPLFGGIAENAPSPREIHLPRPPELTRADLYTVPAGPAPQAVLVLCPGMNGIGRGLLTSPWISFARRQNLGLVALSFASSEENLQNGRGYYYPSRGAGQALLEGLRSVYGCDLPVLLYGMSGGAHFTARFAEWKPERVVSWCAYTAAWWDRPKAASAAPPGIVACGDADFRYGASMEYFLRGRALGKRWTWVSLPRTGHEGSFALDDFVRTYFAAVLDRKSITDEWRDVDLKRPVDRRHAASEPTLACWLPNGHVAKIWTEIHQP